jgi:hypothetical protein
MRLPSVGSPLEVYPNFTDPRVKIDLVKFSIQFWPELWLIKVAEQDRQVPSPQAAVCAEVEVCALLPVFAQPPPEACRRLGLDARCDLNCL